MTERVEYDENGQLDEVVTEGGMHLERMSEKGWFVSGHRKDGSEFCIWFEGTVTMTEERPAVTPYKADAPTGQTPLP